MSRTPNQSVPDAMVISVCSHVPATASNCTWWSRYGTRPGGSESAGASTVVAHSWAVVWCTVTAPPATSNTWSPAWLISTPPPPAPRNGAQVLAILRPSSK